MKQLAALILCNFVCVTANAATADDESSLHSLYLCARTYKELPQLAYDADQKKLEQLTSAVLSEIGAKYSSRDAELMKAKANAAAMKDSPKEYHFKYCSETMTLLQKNKRGPMKSYLIRNE
jgi:hypothetical protein